MPQAKNLLKLSTICLPKPDAMDIVITREFKKNYKHLASKYASLASDLQTLRAQLMENPFLGVELSGGFRKIRLSIRSKGKGKSGGARVITFNYIVDQACQRIVLVKMYDKSEAGNVTDAEIKRAFNTLD